ncbi:bifunctional hydroxymethylpyrimidine kinase/phosphomethylpyrimidine kinase [Paenibacillus crassostreae]|uniref:Hydroxymethylpyrimidine/phosphomethylpyrimidine kinase n=1 Tax=Paenibacillus crassostreae TaxID=1763538 RepID=A0A167G3H0_9BACL|nr:bifunctional hydroxymethylpyrimidine kinase/phosphomethylpyrimidine kinase [Paenibacillus crassostreae]AOZ93794.1 bifunctional hydroxymethylpyrimidine kinase/phosphomethylpyrimidine kinase [Paenibacillus crassostreae]OAB77172.1 hydroxymethylpyrimidine/phosphomethylpyrimidine kinase [Paenibacillus crassostreae]
MVSIYKALTIAGSDSGGGAGIQADLKTFQELNVYGMSAITAVTAQNTLGVQAVFPMSSEALMKQLESIGSDLEPDAVKTGMLFSTEIIQIVAEKVEQHQWHNLIIDPVMIAKGGSPLLQQEAIQSVIRYLLPLALITTPNLPEAEILTGMSILTLGNREEAAKIIHQMGSRYVVVKGGHDDTTDQVVDLLYDGQSYVYMENTRIKTKHTHGTGCTYSAAITAELAKGTSVLEAVQTAKHFIQAAIEDQLGIGAGHGPTNHFAYQRRQRGEVHASHSFR